MSDEIASATLQTSQKAIKVALELIKMLAPLAQKALSEVYHKSVDGINTVGGAISNIRSMGTVSAKNLVAEAQKASSPISTTSNFLARDAEQIAAKAKHYNIPLAIIGEGEKRTIEFLDRDKAAVEQITNEVMQERLKEMPQSVKCFSVGENNVSSLKSMFEENGIECQFVGGKDGKISCIYPAEYAEQVAVIKEDYKRAYSEVSEHFSVSADVTETARQMEISARINEITNAEIGSAQRSEVYENILSDMQNRGVELPQFGENNMQIISNKMPNAIQTASREFWEQQGYKLNEGAKGVEISVLQVDESGNPVLDENGNQTFTNVTVYDISETNAYETAVRDELNSLHNEYAEERAAAISQSGIYVIIVFAVLYVSAGLGAAMDLSVDDEGVLDFNIFMTEVESVLTSPEIVWEHFTDFSGYSAKITLIVAFALGIYALMKYTSRKRLHRKGVEHGSARWANEKEEKFLEDKPEKKKGEMPPAKPKSPFETDNNIILTQEVRMSLNTRQHRENLNVLVIGGSGSGKSRFYVKWQKSKYITVTIDRSYLNKQAETYKIPCDMTGAATLKLPVVDEQNRVLQFL